MDYVIVPIDIILRLVTVSPENTSSNHASNSHNHILTTDHSTGAHRLDNSGTINNYGSLSVSHHYAPPHDLRSTNSQTMRVHDFARLGYHTAHSAELRTNVPNLHDQTHEQTPQSSFETHPETRGARQPNFAPDVTFQYSGGSSVSEHAQEPHPPPPYVQGSEGMYPHAGEYATQDRPERGSDSGWDERRQQKRRRRESKWKRKSKQPYHTREQDARQSRDDGRGTIIGKNGTVLRAGTRGASMTVGIIVADGIQMICGDGINSPGYYDRRRQDGYV